jgi:hypothetical protein
MRESQWFLIYQSTLNRALRMVVRNANHDFNRIQQP